MALGFAISVAIFFGDVPEDRSVEVRRAFADIGRILSRKFASPVRLLLWIPTPEHRRLTAAITRLDDFTYHLIRRASPTGRSATKS